MMKCSFFCCIGFTAFSLVAEMQAHSKPAIIRISKTLDFGVRKAGKKSYTVRRQYDIYGLAGYRFRYRLAPI